MKDEAQRFLEKMATLQELEQVTDVLGFVFSQSGFTRDAIVCLQEHYVAWSDDERWLD